MIDQECLIGRPYSSWRVVRNTRPRNTTATPEATINTLNPNLAITTVELSTYLKSTLRIRPRSNNNIHDSPLRLGAQGMHILEFLASKRPMFRKVRHLKVTVDETTASWQSRRGLVKGAYRRTEMHWAVSTLAGMNGGETLFIWQVTHHRGEMPTIMQAWAIGRCKGK